MAGHQQPPASIKHNSHRLERQRALKAKIYTLQQNAYIRNRIRGSNRDCRGNVPIALTISAQRAIKKKSGTDLNLNSRNLKWRALARRRKWVEQYLPSQKVPSFSCPRTFCPDHADVVDYTTHRSVSSWHFIYTITFVCQFELLKSQSFIQEQQVLSFYPNNEKRKWVVLFWPPAISTTFP